MRLVLVFACVLASFTAPCSGQEPQRSSTFYIAPIVNVVQLDDDRAANDEAALTVAAGLTAQRWNFELNVFRGRFDGANGDDVTMDAAGFEALRVFRRDARLTPFAIVGVGTQRDDRTITGSFTNAYADAGGGFFKTIRRSENRALLLRLDARARYADEGGRLDYLFGVGLQYAFGSPRLARAPEDIATPEEPAAVSLADADRDGVPDVGDRCSGTEQGRSVRADGCEIDADRDGVADANDDCPGTEAEARVDSRGCELGEEVVRVTFAYDSDRLLPDAIAALDRAVDTLRRVPSVQIEVGGHTDNRGLEAYNLVLSQRRADTVRRYLVGRGVANVLTVRGYGETEPVGDNDTEVGRAGNRRVVLRVIAR